MQNSPSQVHNCTGPSRRIVNGISRSAAKISRAFPTGPPLPAGFTSARVGSSNCPGGYSLVVYTVHSTAPINAAAPR